MKPTHKIVPVPSDVFDLGHDFKMIGSDAGRDLATMMENETRRDRANLLLVHGPIGSHSTLPDSDGATPAICGPSPDPAGCLVAFVLDHIVDLCQVANGRVVAVDETTRDAITNVRPAATPALAAVGRIIPAALTSGRMAVDETKGFALRLSSPGIGAGRYARRLAAAALAESHIEGSLPDWEPFACQDEYGT